MNRRTFVKAAASLSSASILGACGLPADGVHPTMTSSPQILPSDTPPLPTLEPTPQPTIDGRLPVALVRSSDRGAGIEQALDLLGVRGFQGKRLFLKPNFNSADPPPGSSHVGSIAALVRKLRGMGADRITVGDRSGMGDTRAVMHAKGIFDLAAELEVDALVFDELGQEDWGRVALEDAHWADGFPFAAPILEHDGVVQLCCLKTHRFGGHFTLSLKNSVGMVAKQVPGYGYNYMNELHYSRHQRSMIAEINAAYTPDLVVLDGMEAFLDGGPDRGALAQPGVILASADRVAIDAVGVALLRYYGTTADVREGPVFEQEQIRRAVELGLGVDGPGQIHLITSDAAGAELAAALEAILRADGA